WPRDWSSDVCSSDLVFQEVLHVPIVGTPIANHDDNQHAENENLRIRNLWDGIELYAGLLARLGPEWRAAGKSSPCGRGTVDGAREGRGEGPRLVLRGPWPRPGSLAPCPTG